ncbi:uncharacterized protein [Aristolochia californica]|uniref:uncharacterized protein n=1 Tax=Aristolochia californica TaxID=171875 RepID=UPI0035DFF121
MRTVRRVRRGVVLCRNFQVLRSITSSKSLRRNSVIMNALNYIKELKLKMEATNENIKCLSRQEVTIESVELGFLVRVSCEKGRELLVTILGAFEAVGLNVIRASVSCSNSFFMEAICEAQDRSLDASSLKQALLQELQKKEAKYDIGSLRI